jgi:hypothetical protein
MGQTKSKLEHNEDIKVLTRQLTFLKLLKSEAEIIIDQQKEIIELKEKLKSK